MHYFHLLSHELNKHINQIFSYNVYCDDLFFSPLRDFLSARVQIYYSILEFSEISWYGP